MGTVEISIPSIYTEVGTQDQPYWLLCNKLLVVPKDTPQFSCTYWEIIEILWLIFVVWRALCMPVLSRFSRVWLFATLWTTAYQAPLSMGFSRQEYWSGLPCPPPGDLPDLGIEPASLMSPASAGGFWTINATWKAQAFFPSLPHPLQCYLLGQWAAVCGPAAEIRENCLNFPE